MTDLTYLKRIPILDYLQRRGITPIRMGKGGTEAWCLTPWREEKTPSLQVNLTRNIWRDWGGDAGGSILDLVMALEGVSFRQAIRHLEGGQFTIPHLIPEPPRTPTIRSQFIEAKDLTHPALLRMIQDRKVSLGLAVRYAQEITFTTPHRKGKPLFAMGWQTIKGGYELRNPIGKFGLAPKGITFLQGTHHHQACHVFEGLFDCLAWLTARNQPQADVDCLILNSTALVNQAVTWLNAQAHADIFLWCDNDPTGDKATTFLINQLEITSATQRQIKDMRPHYRGHKDVNDWWLGKARPPSP